MDNTTTAMHAISTPPPPPSTRSLQSSHRGVLLDVQPAHVGEKETALGVVGVRVRLGVLVVHAVVSRPVVDRTLVSHGVDQHHEYANAPVRVVRSVRPQPVDSARNSNTTVNMAFSGGGGWGWGWVGEEKERGVERVGVGLEPEKCRVHHEQHRSTAQKQHKKKSVTFVIFIVRLLIVGYSTVNLRPRKSKSLMMHPAGKIMKKTFPLENKRRQMETSGGGRGAAVRDSVCSESRRMQYKS